jgi:hypothetical protein
MPNICNNELTLTGPISKLKAFLKVHPATIDLQKVWPLEGKQSAARVWGTKWLLNGRSKLFEIEPAAADGDSDSEQESKLVYRFESAWSPFGSDVLEMICDQSGASRAVLRFADQGSPFCGQFVCEDGLVDLEEAVWDDSGNGFKQICIDELDTDGDQKCSKVFADYVKQQQNVLYLFDGFNAPDDDADYGNAILMDDSELFEKGVPSHVTKIIQFFDDEVICESTGPFMDLFPNSG